MRIVVDYRPALRARTGVGHYVFHLVEALLARDALVRQGDPQGTDELTLFTSSWRDRPAAADVARLAGARFVDRRLPVRLLNLLWHRAAWPPVERLVGSAFDVAYSPHPLLLPSSGAAQVVTIHDLDFLAHPERAEREVRRDYTRLVRAHAHAADHVIVVSHYTARQVQGELGLSADRMTVCYPGGPEVTPPVKGRRDHVLLIGTLEARKNIGGVLDAYASLVGRRPDMLPLVLAGGARPEAAEWLERIRRPPLAGRVRYAGYVSDDERRRLLEAAAVFVLPSLEEGFGMAVVEAMAAGVPVVVSDRGALPEVVADAGIVLRPDDIEGLAGAIERLVDDDAYRSAAAARAVQRARQFRWAATAAAARLAFERAVQSHGRAGGRR